MAKDAEDAEDAVTDAELARRLQILATEHWGLLAARSSAQSEVLTRITIHLTLVSYFLASTHDDELGMRVTYSFLRHRGAGEQVLGSSTMLSILVNATVTGMFVGGLCAVLSAPVPGAVVVGVVVGLCVVAAGVWYASYRFVSAWRSYTPLSPSDAPPAYWRMRPRR